MSSNHIWSTYNARAKGYAAALGHTEVTTQEDHRLIARWTREVQGRIVGLGCGSGHWTAYFHDLGLQVEGVDPVKGFIEIVRDQHPHVTYRQGSSARLSAGSYGAVLAWYSLIHIPPQELPGTLASLRDNLTLRGSLLIGFFTGGRAKEFPHTVAPVYH